MAIMLAKTYQPLKAAGAPEADAIAAAEQLRAVRRAGTSSLPSPVPTQVVASDECMPVPRAAKQREVEAGLEGLSDRVARRQGLSGRRFFQAASGMAASYLVMKQVFG